MFSIIICTYNGHRTLHKAINSVLSQDRYSDLVSDFIIVDNASTDDTSEIVKSFSCEKIIYSYEAKPGLGNARRNGVLAARGEWIAFIDDDNLLDHNWLVSAEKYIRNHREVCIFGGSIIPHLDFDATNEEIERLHHCKGMLACTNNNRSEIDYSITKSPIGGTVGAGMVVEAKWLIEYINRGWLTQMGRTKDNTASGEDGEIRLNVLKISGKAEGYCPQMIIEHDLPRARLECAYLLNLAKSLTIASYNYQSMQRFYILRRLKSALTLLLKKCPYEDESFLKEMWSQNKFTYLQMINRDYFTRRLQKEPLTSEMEK